MCQHLLMMNFQYIDEKKIIFYILRSINISIAWQTDANTKQEITAAIMYMEECGLNMKTEPGRVFTTLFPDDPISNAAVNVTAMEVSLWEPFFYFIFILWGTKAIFFVLK